MNAIAQTLALALVTTTLACSAATTSSGGGGGGGGGDGGGGGGGNDSGGSSGGGTINIDFPASCPAEVACGGSEIGTWDYTGACVDDPFGPVRQACGGITVNDAKGTLTGSLTLDGVAFLDHTTSTVAATLGFPSECSLAGCAPIEDALKKQGFTATCAGSSTCSCAVSKTTSTASSNTYTKDATTVTTNGVTYDYCVQSGTLTYKAIQQDQDPGRFTLAKRN